MGRQACASTIYLSAVVVEREEKGERRRWRCGDLEPKALKPWGIMTEPWSPVAFMIHSSDAQDLPDPVGHAWPSEVDLSVELFVSPVRSSLLCALPFLFQAAKKVTVQHFVTT